MSREGLDQGWWQSPRWLGDELIDRRLTPTEALLVSFIASRREAEPEGDGYATSLDFLMRVLRVSDTTIRRALKRACSSDLLVSDLRQGQRTPFRVWVGPRLRSPLRSDTGVPVTEVTSVSGEAQDPPETASEAGLRAERLRSSRARANETETERDAAEEFQADEDLDRVLLPLERVGGSLTGIGRSQVASAFAECPEGVRAIVERIARASGINNPLGALVSSVRKGEHREASEVRARSRALSAPCPKCGIGGGRHLEDCPLAPAGPAAATSGRGHDRAEAAP